MADYNIFPVKNSKGIFSFIAEYIIHFIQDNDNIVCIVRIIIKPGNWRRCTFIVTESVADFFISGLTVTVGF